MHKPNIVVIMADQLKAKALRLYWGGACPTPALEKLAGEGVLFENAFTPHPLCVPARVSLWTAQYACTHGARRNQTFMPADARHAFKIWKGAGYHLALIGKNHCFEQPDDLALFDTWCEISHRGLPDSAECRGLPWFRPREKVDLAHSVRRHMPWQSPKVSYAVSDYGLDDYSTGLIAGQTERFLAERGSEPFVLWVSFPDPHEPYEASGHYTSMTHTEDIELPPWRPEALEGVPERNRLLHEMLGVEEADTGHLRETMRVYYANLRFIDDAVGRIMHSLEENGQRERTIVVFCSDHGDFMGERRMTVKGGVFYDCLTRIPLIVSWPGRLPQNLRDDSPVSLVDVVPSLFSLQGMAIPRSMQGRPLPTVTAAPARDAAFSEYGAGGPLFTRADLERAPRPFGYRTLIQSLQWREAEGRRKMVRTVDWKYVHDPMGDLDELYDIKNDPWELTNLAGDSSYDGVARRLRDRLLEWSILHEDAHPVSLPEARLIL